MTDHDFVSTVCFKGLVARIGSFDESLEHSVWRRRRRRRRIQSFVLLLSVHASFPSFLDTVSSKFLLVCSDRSARER